MAIECFDIVLKLKSQNKTALYNKASSIIKSGKLKEGLVVLSQLIKLDSAYKQQAKCDIDFVGIKGKKRTFCPSLFCNCWIEFVYF